MAETNKSQVMSEAELIEAIDADTLVSISLGAGQPQKNVKLSTLATVVAGLINFPFKYRSEIKNANEALTSGIYRIYGVAENAPTFSFGVLVTFNAAEYILQVANDVGSTNPSAKFRTRNSNGVWSNWKDL